MKIGRLFGIPLYLHWSFFVFILGFTGWMMYDAHSKSSLTSTTSYIALAMIVPITILVIFSSVLLHEFGHALTAKYYGRTVHDITLYPIGGIASIDIPDDPHQEFWIILNGPLVNVALAWIYLGLSYLTMSSVWCSLLLTLAQFNLTLLAFNALPIFPMDGGRLLRCILCLKFDYEKSTRIVINVAKVVGMGAIVYFAYHGIYMACVCISVVLLIGGTELTMIRHYAWCKKLQEVLEIAQTSLHTSQDMAKALPEHKFNKYVRDCIFAMHTDPMSEKALELWAALRIRTSPNKLGELMIELAIEYLQRQNTQLDYVWCAIRQKKSLHEIDAMLESIVDEGFKAECSKIVQDSMPRA